MSEQNRNTDNVDPYQADRLAAFETHAYLANGDVNERLLDEMTLGDMPLIRARSEQDPTHEELVDAIDSITEQKITGEVQKLHPNLQTGHYDQLWEEARTAYEEEQARLEKNPGNSPKNPLRVVPTPAKPQEDPLADVIRSMNARRATTAGGKHIGSVRSASFSHLKGASEGSTHENIKDEDERSTAERRLGKATAKILATRSRQDGIPRTLATGFQPYAKDLLADTNRVVSEKGVTLSPRLHEKGKGYQPRRLEGLAIKRRQGAKHIKENGPDNIKAWNALLNEHTIDGLNIAKNKTLEVGSAVKNRTTKAMQTSKDKLAKFYRDKTISREELRAKIKEEILAPLVGIIAIDLSHMGTTFSEADRAVLMTEDEQRDMQNAMDQALAELNDENTKK